MHPDLIPLDALWRLDREMDAIRAAAQKLNTDIETARSALVVSTTERDTLSAATKERAEAERILSRKLDRYTSHRERAQRLMDAGTNYASALRQHEQCSEIIDEIELEILELMEQQEVSDARSAELAVQIARETTITDDLVARRADERPDLEVRFGELEAARPGKLAAVAFGYRAPYARLRRQGTPALSAFTGKHCGHCHLEAAPQIHIDCRTERRVHACRGCGAYLQAPAEAEE